MVGHKYAFETVNNRFYFLALIIEFYNNVPHVATINRWSSQGTSNPKFDNPVPKMGFTVAKVSNRSLVDVIEPSFTSPLYVI